MLLRYRHFDQIGSIIKQILLNPYQISQIIGKEGSSYKTLIGRQRTYLIDEVLGFSWDFLVWCMFVEMKEINIKTNEEHHRRFRILSSVFLVAKGVP